MFKWRIIFVSRREQEHLIQTVYPGSIAEELEIEPGDVLLKINGQKINLNLAITYDEISDETTVYLGVPLLNTDF
jgi:S1-C subfamily serine protease